jgi:hypothetical protein
VNLERKSKKQKGKAIETDQRRKKEGKIRSKKNTLLSGIGRLIAPKDLGV